MTHDHLRALSPESRRFVLAELATFADVVTADVERELAATHHVATAAGAETLVIETTRHLSTFECVTLRRAVAASFDGVTAIGTDWRAAFLALCEAFA